MQADLRGVQFHGAWFSAWCEEGDPLTLEREPTNKEDPNAIKVLHERGHLGYIGRELAAELAPAMDRGVLFEAHFVAIWALEYATTNGEITVTEMVTAGV
jgi:hypothetical protein